MFFFALTIRLLDSWGDGPEEVVWGHEDLRLSIWVDDLEGREVPERLVWR